MERDIAMKRTCAALLSVALIIGLSSCNTQTPPDGSSVTGDSQGNVSTVESDISHTGTSSSESTSPVENNTVSTATKETSSGSVTQPSSEPSSEITFPVKPKRPAQQTSWLINNQRTGALTKIRSERSQINTFDSQWAYTHHGAINWFKGKIYTLWSNGRFNEDDCGQRVMLSSTSDFKKWETEILVDSQSGIGSPPYQIPLGLFTDGETLTAYYMVREYDSTMVTKAWDGYPLRPFSNVKYSSIGNGTYYVRTTDGVNWSKPEKLFHTPTSAHTTDTLTGRIFGTGGARISYTDDPSGLTGWTNSGLTDAQVEDAYKRGAKMLVEGTIYQTKDYVLHYLFRTETGYLWHTESYDNGETWSNVYPTQFTNDMHMTYFGRLPDGRIYYIGTPNYSGTNARSTLMLYISEDGINFGEQYILRDETDYRMQQIGFAKGGAWGYPRSFIHDGYIYVIYSKQKEVMEVTRVAIADLNSSKAKEKVTFSDSQARLFNFDSQAQVDKVQALGDSKLNYDSAEKAMKVTVARGGDVNNKAAFEIPASLLNSSANTKEYPVLAIRVKKNNYEHDYMGPTRISTTKSMQEIPSNPWVTLSGTFYRMDDEWQTIIIDFSDRMRYPSSRWDKPVDPVGWKLFDGQWQGLQISLAHPKYTDINNSTFYVKWLGTFKSVEDAQKYVMLNG